MHTPLVVSSNEEQGIRISGNSTGNRTLSCSNTSRATVPTQVVIPANAEPVQFTVDILDDRVFHYDQLLIFAEAEGASEAVELTIIVNDNPWHHYGLRLDVSGDGLLSAIDALLIINQLNSVGPGSLANRTVVFPPGQLEFDGDFVFGQVFVRDARTTIFGRDARATLRGFK